MGPRKTGAKSPLRPADGWQHFFQVCSLASMSYTTLAASACRSEPNAANEGALTSHACPRHQFCGVLERARETGSQDTLLGRPPLVLIISTSKQDAARANKPCQATSA